jgi:uncharacterized protein YdhG (YjbR/CyaY superfamily)
MVQSTAATVKEYLEELPEDRRKAISKVRAVIRKNLPKGFVEKMNWGMICYEVPLKTVPDTYNGKPLMYAGLASQKNHMAVYLSNVYADPEITDWFINAYKDTGKKLDMGKSCVRFKKLENLPLEVIGEAIAFTSLEDFVELYENPRT